MLAASAGWLARRDSGTAASPVIPGEEGGERVTVEVLNGTTIDGLARQMTRRLRRKGLDVVFFGTAPTAERESTVVIARRGDTMAARRVRQALGVGSVTNEPQAQLLLDVTVVLGRDAAAVSASTRN